VGAVAAVLVVAIALVVILRQRGPQPDQPGNSGEPTASTEPRLPAPPARGRTAFVLSKAAVKVPAAAVLTFRTGSEDARAFLSELASALEPYRKDDFAEAARRLEPLARKYRESAEARLYLGVSRLFLDEPLVALASLEAGRRFADDALRDDVSWYLALAFDRAGRVDDARQELRALCLRPGEYQKRACASLDELN